MTMIKYTIKCFIRFILRVFFIIPVRKKTIFFESFDGNELCCSPYYIFDYLRKNTTDYKFIVSSKTKKQNFENVKYVKTKSVSWVLAQIYSGIQITNTGFKVFVPYRKSQLLINTWHGGGAYKKVGRSDNAINNPKYLDKSNIYVNKHLSYFISSSKEFSKVIKDSVLIPEEKFIDTGLPRNDIFFNKEKTKKANHNIREKFNISDDAFVVLYAPTFRGDMANANFTNQLDFYRLKNVLEKKTEKEVVLAYRGHYFIKSNSSFEGIDYNWSSEPNMQDLLCCADFLITDYSSSMWDYSYTGKPCFLFVPDFESYLKSRGFYTDPFDWGFPICKSNDELECKIKDFDENNYLKAIERHHQIFGSFEKGDATETIANLIISKSRF